MAGWLRLLAPSARVWLEPCRRPLRRASCHVAGWKERATMVAATPLVRCRCSWAALSFEPVWGGFAPSAVPRLPLRRGRVLLMGEQAWYRGYRITVTDRDFRVEAPNGDRRAFKAMSSVRSWVRRHQRGKP